ncbi:MAG: 30S ribosomal protein S17 [Erysipelotrichaceae bacterium]|jgi:small subunit ribosomal protein S17
MKERSARKVYRGVVVSNKSNKTIIVEVTTSKDYEKYSKRVKYSKKFAVHDEDNVANVGDKVTIMETRPLSATKHFRLIKVVEKAPVL